VVVLGEGKAVRPPVEKFRNVPSPGVRTPSLMPFMYGPSIPFNPLGEVVEGGRSTSFRAAVHIP